MQKFEDWLAVSPLASMLKVMLGAGLGAALSWLTTSDMHPLIIAVAAASLPVAINALNPQDPRWGRVDWDEFNNG